MELVVEPGKIGWLLSATGSVARFTVLEVVRSRLPVAASVVLVVGELLGMLIGSIGLAEADLNRVALVGAGWRLAAVLLVGVMVVVGTAREINDRMTILLLSLPIPRSVWFFGRFLGFSGGALGLALLFGAGLSPFVPGDQVFLWGVTLGCELLLVVGMGLFFTLGLGRLVPSLLAVVGCYLFCRSLETLILLASGPLPEYMSLPDRVVVGVLTAVGVVLPRLGEAFGGTSWLVYHDGHWGDLLPVLRESGLSLLVFLGAGLFDLHRKDC
ncbi:MAG: hypothetical protein HQL57_05930 [Magnetococcales bacterium]|nr:hypothetical protein [Magnetococcales bacterium]